MTTITIERASVKKWLEGFVNCDSNKDFVGYAIKAATMFREALAAPATAPEELERLRKDAERKPMTDEDTLALFNRIQLRMRFTDADARPFASGVASAEFFHGIK